ncbi:MAG TPA: hypothetical protein VEF04_07645, partial [Blastocatellia bacterium]|nr:hypothetical protein [Blastocatellia bacterium]
AGITMKVMLTTAILVIAITVSVVAMSRTSQVKVDAEFPGSALKWIHIAEGEFERKGLNPDKYMVGVIEEKDSVYVSLTGFNPPKGIRGCWGPNPCYVVEISKKDLKVVRAHYIR